jgi:hypothetical protein
MGENLCHLYKELLTRIYRAQKTKLAKNQWPNEEMDKWTKLSFFQRKKSKWLKKHEEMLNIPGHKGNANQNHIKIPPHSY